MIGLNYETGSELHSSVMTEALLGIPRSTHLCTNGIFVHSCSQASRAGPKFLVGDVKAVFWVPKSFHSSGYAYKKPTQIHRNTLFNDEVRLLVLCLPGLVWPVSSVSGTEYIEKRGSPHHNIYRCH